MATANCYYEVETKSTIATELFDIAITPGDWLPYYHFGVRLIPPEVLNKDDFFKWLSQKYSFIAGILKYDPYTCYDWHTDAHRGVGINMLLTPNTRSFCAFKFDTDQIVSTIQELKYKPNTYYLFNTQVPHTVYNFETTRYLFSIEFAKNKDELSFEDLVNDIEANYK